jgi:hypothetical protein
MLFIATEKQRAAPVRTVLVHQSDPPRTISEGDQVLAEQADLDGRAIRLGNFLRQQRRCPVSSEELTDERIPSRLGQQMVLRSGEWFQFNLLRVKA